MGRAIRRVVARGARHTDCVAYWKPSLHRATCGDRFHDGRGVDYRASGPCPGLPPNAAGLTNTSLVRRGRESHAGPMLIDVRTVSLNIK